ncbi:MAG: radical SAM family heme chaperone HemW [Kiritimatiellales bacterium]|nr:radical SAM family heme chaperone HemW [Kiritimatiellales bacterium]
MSGLYIHIPICIAKCTYCDFYSVVSRDWKTIDRFFQCLETELKRLPTSFAPETIFIGGGTPPAVSAEQLAQLIEIIHGNIDVSQVREWSCEANPGTLDRDKVGILRNGGVNRVSLGIQSFHEKALKLLGRIHTAEEAIKGFRMLRDAGFDNLNIDLIQSIPGMKTEDVLADARKVTELDPEHISYYNLIYEPGTAMTRDRDEGRIVPPSDDEEADNYFAVKAILEGAGYGHYEISNFSKPAAECRHNLLYWKNGEYFGVGPAAHSHWNGARFGNVRDLGQYCGRLLDGKKPFDEVERLDPETKAREFLVMWLRLTDGVDLEEFELLTGYSVDALCGTDIEHMVAERLLQRLEGRLRLSNDALFISNAVLSELVQP